MNCEFCELYSEVKENNKRAEKEFREKGKPIKNTYKICLYEKTTRIGWGVKDAGIITYKPMKFNYCPVCGKAVE